MAPLTLNGAPYSISVNSATFAENDFYDCFREQMHVALISAPVALPALATSEPRSHGMLSRMLAATNCILPAAVH
jgi:hypothetical protein